MKIADKDLKCYFSDKPIHKGESYFPYTVYENDTLETVAEELAIHPEAKLIIDKLDMFGNGTDNDCFLPQDYEDLVDDYFNDLNNTGDISDEEFDIINSNNGEFDRHDAVFKCFTKRHDIAKANL